MKAKLIPFLTFISIASCAPIYVNYDYENETDFSVYKSYDLYPEIKTSLSELDNNRLYRAIDEVLKSHGFAISETPDFYINVQSRTYQSGSRNSVGVGIGGSGRNVGGGISVGIPVGQSNVDIELIFDVIDVKKDALIWKAVSEGSFNPNASPETREERLKAIVVKVFSEFPPTKE